MFKYVREFIREVFPSVKVKVRDVLVVPEDIVPLYRMWCIANGLEG